MTSKVIEGQKSLSNFTVNQTLPLLDGPLILPSPNCLYLSLSILFFLPHSLSTSLLILHWSTFLKVTQGYFYVAWFLIIFRSFDQIITLTYKFYPCFNLNLHSYGQLFVLVFRVMGFWLRNSFLTFSLQTIKTNRQIIKPNQYIFCWWYLSLLPVAGF